MKKKLISFAIAFALLSQTLVFAGPIFNAVGGTETEDVAATITSSVKGYDGGTGMDNVYSSKTAYKMFDYKVGVEFGDAEKGVKEALDRLYKKGHDTISTFAPTYITAFENSDVTGNFTIEFTYDDGVDDTVVAPTFTDLNTQFAAEGSIFSATAVSLDTTARKFTVYATMATTKAKDLSSKLKDITLSWSGLKLTSSADYNRTIKAKLTGTVKIFDFGESSIPSKTPYGQINLESNVSTVNANFYDTNPAIGGGGGGGGEIINDGDDEPTPPGPGPVIETPVITVENGSVIPTSSPAVTATSEQKEDGSIVITVEPTATEDSQDGEDGQPVAPTQAVVKYDNPEAKDGFVPNGYSLTPFAGGDKNDQGSLTVNLDPDKPVVLYPRYVNVTVPEALAQETDDNGNPLHKSYISGYPDGEVKPNNNISREEVTAAFDRLLNAAFRSTIETASQDFPDVNSDRWSNTSIATMANGGFIVGDESGNFNPDKPITRAEFAVIASKFAPVDAEPAENYFTDIEDHWAKDFILKIAGQYWISGYGDGSFNPDGYITRAEAMAIINRMLVRYGDDDSEYGTEWPDVSENDWYYDIVKESTTNNVFVRTENGWSETWVDEQK